MGKGSRAGMEILRRYRLAFALGMPASAVALTAIGAWGVARRMVAPRPTPDKHFTPWELGVPFEEVAFQTSDGLTLHGWWLSHQGTKRTMITLTGHRGGRSDTLGIGTAMWRSGLNVLLFDYRGRGTSSPSINTLGYYETLDGLAAVEYVYSRVPEASVGLIGYSMGGAVAIMAAAREERIRTVIADSPFASQRQVIRSYFRNRLKVPYFPLVYLTQKFLPYDIDEVEPIREIGKIAPRAVMLIHAGQDVVTNPRDSQALYEAAGEPKEMWALAMGGHCAAYFLDRMEYAERVTRFLDRHL